MPEKDRLTARIRFVGLIASIVAVVAIGVTVVTGNQDLGGNKPLADPNRFSCCQQQRFSSWCRLRFS